VKKGIILAIGLAMGGVAFLAGCGDQAAKIPIEPKWKGAAYHLAFDTQAPKPNPVGLTFPGIKFTANPEAVETRALLVVKFDASGATKSGPVADQMIMPPVDISGTEGALPADYINLADKDLSKILGAYCIKGKVKMNVALARSSVSPQAAEGEVDSKRLSDWMPIELEFKNPHPKC